MGNINFPGATLLIAGFITLVVGGIILGWCWMICFTRRITGSSSIVAVAPPTTTSSNSTSPIKDQVDPKRVSSTPSFVVSSAVKKDKLECAVCLTELKDGEKGRLLSRCGHSFHASCIDTWFQSNSTCPPCRSPVLL